MILERKGENKVAVVNPYNYVKPKKVVLQSNPSKAFNPSSIIDKSSKDKSKQDAYLTQKVMNAKPEELTMMLYEGLVRFIRLAKFNLDKSNVQLTNENAIKAQKIVDELASTLNMEYEISENLSSLYEFMNNELMQGNIKKESEHFDNALEIAEELSYTWREAMNLF